VHSFYKNIGKFAVKARYFVVAFWILVSIFVVHSFPSLNSVTNSNNSDFLPANSPSTRAEALDAPFAPSGVVPVQVIVVSKSGPLTTQDISILANLKLNLTKVKTVVKVQDMGISLNKGAELFQVLSNASNGEGSQDKVLIADITKQLNTSLRNTDLLGHVGGNIAIQVASQSKSGTTSSQLQLFSIIFIVVLLLLVFRSILAPFLVILPAFLVVVISGPIIAELSKYGLKVSSISSVLLIVLLLGAGTDYGLFLIFRQREEIRNGLSHHDAIIKAVSRVGESITFSAGTVIAALLSLLASTFGLYQSLGAPLAIGIFIMLLAGLTLLPAILAIFGRAVYWPSRPNQNQKTSGVWGEISSSIVKRPAATLIVGLILFGTLAGFSSGNKPAGFGATATAPPGTDAAVATQLISQYFPKTSSNPTVLIFKFATPIWQNPSDLTKIQSDLASSGYFNKISGPLSDTAIKLTSSRWVYLHSVLGSPSELPPLPPPSLSSTSITKKEYLAYVASKNFVSSSGTTVQFMASLTTGDPSNTTSINMVPQIRTTVTNIASQVKAIDSGVAGEAPAIYDISSVSSSDLKTVIPISVIVIAILLFLVMRSLVAPFYLIASVAISYFAALGASVILFIFILKDGGLTFILPFLMFVFLLALGEDYNILVMTRIREEAHGLTLKQAVSKALSTTGTTVTSAGLVLAGTFVVLAIEGAISGSSQIRDVGFGLALGIVMDTFFVRTLLVPSTVVLLGRYNWWPSKLYKVTSEIYPETEIED
jgi:RND superfamily putative drug exporter